MNENMIGVDIWEEKVIIPTYETGEADKNPMFFEKRVYQGSSGKVYPYPLTEKISYEKKDKEYKAVFLENQYLKVMILPELGGRIQRAYDKTNDYDFVYYNHVIKPAHVGLLGPWISGGIEFNWPQHHRPTTFLPVDHVIQENDDGSRTVLVNDVDQMYGTKGIAGFTLYPDKSYIEIRGQIYNRTAMPQTFLWWANPAIPVNEYTQTIFPPDVHSVYDHGKRDVSRWPVAMGTYYKYDYSEGIDISRHKNIPVPSSMMAEESAYDFVGGYDYRKKAGLLHVADHHISPGKKQWTWGNGNFGHIWDENLTDEDGPYVELMTGIYTDNQPDFTWLKPYEEKTFKQYFMPYKAVGEVKNATTDAVVNLTLSDKDKIYVCVYATSKYDDAEIIVTNKEKEIFHESAKISPENVFETIFYCEVEKEEDLKIRVLDKNKVLVEYQPLKEEIPKLAEPAIAAKDPEEIMTTEELLLTGQHIEQYRHATYLPDSYYLEGLRRDKGDIRLNNAYGLLLMRRGQFGDAEKHFKKALERLTRLNPNPYDSEAYYNLGVTLFYQERYQEAYDAFFKATWTNDQQEMSFYYLAAIQVRNNDYTSALELIDQSLVKNAHNIKARGLRALILRRLGWNQEAKKQIWENLKLDKFDYYSMFEREFVSGEKTDRFVMRNFHENYLMTARDYAESGGYEEALKVLSECTQNHPMLHYYKGYYYGKLGNIAGMEEEYHTANQCDPAYCFPNKLNDIAVLNDAILNDPFEAKAYYYLGNLFYDKLQYETAIQLWEKSEEIDDKYPTLERNLALGYYNKRNDQSGARKKLEKAFSLDKSDARVFMELDQLYKILGVSLSYRLKMYDDNRAIITERDDLYTEYVTLLNLAGRNQDAYDSIMNYVFRPWEGGEGKISTQYKIALSELAQSALKIREYQRAKELLQSALIYPDNLGEGKLVGTKDNDIYYILGLALEGLGEDSAEMYSKAACGESIPAGAMYYNDQPADMVYYQGKAFAKLGDAAESNKRFYILLDYGERHLNEEMKTDYFAVSAPDFQIFEGDLKKRNKAHCHYIMGLAYLGMGRADKAKVNLQKTLEIEPYHQKARIYLRKMK